MLYVIWVSILIPNCPCAIYLTNHKNVLLSVASSPYYSSSTWPSGGATTRISFLFFFSRIDYCNSLLAELPASTLAPLQRYQNAAARLVLNLKSSDHITPALIELHWLPIKYRVIYKICLLVHKSLSPTAPSYLRELFVTLSNISSRPLLRSSSSTDLLIPATRLQFGDRAFAVAGSRQWNLLPSQIRTISDIGTFKSKLKTHLFIQAFGIQFTVI